MTVQNGGTGALSGMVRRTLLSAGVAALPATASAQVAATTPTPFQVGLLINFSKIDVPSGVDIVQTCGFSSAGLGPSLMAATSNSNAAPFRSRSANGRWFEIVGRSIMPSQVGGLGNGRDDTEAVQAAIEFAGRDSGDGEVVFDRLYSVKSVKMRSGVSLRGLSRRHGLKWLAVSAPGETTLSSATLTRGSDQVSVASAAASHVGMIIRRQNSSRQYVVVDHAQNMLKLHRPWDGESANATTVVLNAPFGMVEYPEGPSVGVNFNNIWLDGSAINPGGFVVYRNADKGAAATGGDWLNSWNDVTIDNCHNGLWLRGTTTAPFSNSVEPVQFNEYARMTVARTAASDGVNLMITGQVNQQTFYAPLLQRYSGTDRKGVCIQIDVEPLSRASTATSNKSPQGLRFMHPSIQGAEYGILAFAGETVEVHNPYLEHLTKAFDVSGYNISNQLDLTIAKIEVKGGIGVSVNPDGFLIRGGPNCRVVLDGGTLKGGGASRLWVDGGGELLVATPPLPVQGVEGFQPSWTDPVTRTVSITNGSIALQGARLALVTGAGPLRNLVSDLWPNSEVRLAVAGTGGMSLASGGNLLLPGNRDRWSVPQGAVISLVRSDAAQFSGWIARLLETSKPIVQRGSSFTLPAIYLHQHVQIVASCTITLPDDQTEPGYAPGDQVEFYLMAEARLTFSANANSVVRAAGGILTTDTPYSRALAMKTAANTWLISFG
ncbi:hypothetical protein ACETKC_16440 [Brevundimonas intermedia]|nr:hypothetical protein [Brevundimonas intermedia]